MTPSSRSRLVVHAAAMLAHRPLWRLVVALAWVSMPLMLAAQLARHFTTGAAGKTVFALLSTALVLASYAMYVRTVEQRAPAELGRARAGPECLVGTFTGIVLFGLVIGLLAIAGVVRVAAQHGVAVVFHAVPGAMATAVFEEIIFRAIVFRNLEEVLGSWMALVASAAIFGAMHLGGPGASLHDALAVAVEAGFMLGAAYMATRRVWLCIGIHFGWNLTQGAVFSLPVSGYPQQGMFASQLVGESWLTGGQFGVESSGVAVALCALLGVALALRACLAGQVMPPRWRRARRAPLPVAGIDVPT